jgi:hypothetical protein
LRQDGRRKEGSMMKKKVTSDKDMRNFRMRGEKKRDNIK